VDDVFDSGRSIRAIFDKLRPRARRNMPETMRVATPWYKPANNRTGRVPDYYLHETDRWLVLPYELTGLSVDQIRRHKKGLAPIFEEIKDWVQP